MKVMSKISYLGERNSILPGQMAEQLSVEVDVKNVTHRCKKRDTQTHTHTQTAIFVNLWQPRFLDRIFSFEVVRMDNSVLTVIRMDYSVFNSHEDG